MGDRPAFWERGGDDAPAPLDAPVEPETERSAPPQLTAVRATDGYATVWVDYGMILFTGADGEASPDLRFVGGLVHLACHGELQVLVGAQSGDVRLRATVHDAAPPVGGDCEDVVEAPLEVGDDGVRVSSLHGSAQVLLAVGPGQARVRVSTRDRVDHGGWEPDRPLDHVAVDIWPVDERTDPVVVRQTSAFAAQAVQTYR